MSTKSENVADDWECINDSELNTKVDELKKSNSSSQQNNTTDTDVECSRQLAAMLLNDDDCMRSYVQPAPAVKILKRPTNDRANQVAVEQKPKAPIKTLQQREQEYAEARLRILGSAKSAEEENEQPVPTPAPVNNTKNSNFHQNNSNGYTNRNVNNGPNQSRQYSRNSLPQQAYHQSQYHQTQFHHQQQKQPQQPQLPLPPQHLHNSHNVIHHQHPVYQQQPSMPYLMQPDMRRVDENVIRLPRGPEGPGFMLKR